MLFCVRPTVGYEKVGTLLVLKKLKTPVVRPTAHLSGKAVFKSERNACYLEC